MANRVYTVVRDIDGMFCELEPGGRAYKNIMLTEWILVSTASDVP